MRTKSTGAKRKTIRRLSERVTKAVRGAGWTVFRVAENNSGKSWYVHAKRLSSIIKDDGTVSFDVIKIRVSDHARPEHPWLYANGIKVPDIPDYEVLAKEDKPFNLSGLQGVLTMRSIPLRRRKANLELTAMMAPVKKNEQNE